MIEVIKPKPKKYIMKCYNCDCVFTYELEDVLHSNRVECPKCHNYIDHYNRITVEVLENDK